MYHRIAIKVGSNVLTRADGTLDFTRMSALVDQLAELRRAGISTQKLHARGPMALEEITTYKWLIRDHGQTRP